MIAMTKNPTKNTLSKVTVSMMTTMTTVPHRDLEIDWSSFPFSIVQSVCVEGVLLVFTVLLPPLRSGAFPEE